MNIGSEQEGFRAMSLHLLDNHDYDQKMGSEKKGLLATSHHLPEDDLVGPGSE